MGPPGLASGFLNFSTMLSKSPFSPPHQFAPEEPEGGRSDG